MEDEFIKKLKGKKIPRKKIRVDKSTMETLKLVKKQINSSLDICEMAECCFDFFDYKNFRSNSTDSLSALQERKESTQILIREDIYNSLLKMKSTSKVSVQGIMSCIIEIQLRKVKLQQESTSNNSLS